MKKKKINKAEKMSNIMSFIILFLLGVIIGLIIGRIELKVNNGIELKNLENCSNEVKKYTNIDGSDVYLFCLQDIVINSNKSLKDYNFDGFMDGLKLEETTYDDGGTKVYTNDDIAIIKCQTLLGNKNIYIGTKDMFDNNKMSVNLCEDTNKVVKEFTRTYKVEKVLQGEEENLFWVTLKLFQAEADTVLVRTNEKLKEGKNYEFTLSTTNTSMDDNIDSIFKNSTLIKIKETDKTGLDQLQEPFN
ncbi:MAG: hypothetical protein IJY87_02305 [Bacilli bacterium]|nr:hypothetical protein [Bacilli bacterium]